MKRIIEEEESPISFEIKIDGRPIPDVISVQEITLDMEVNSIAGATVTILEEHISFEKTPFEHSEGDLFIPGNEIEISLGHTNKKKVVFKGVVVAQRLGVTKGEATLLITCKDKAFRMKTGRFNAIFKDQKESEMIQTLVESYEGVSLKIDKTVATVPSIMQYNCTDWDFMMMRAEVNNMMVTTHQNVLTVKHIDFTKKAEYEIEVGRDVIDMDLNLDSQMMIPELTIASWNGLAKQETEINLKIIDRLGQGNLSVTDLAEKIANPSIARHTAAPLTEKEMTLWGTAIASKTVLAKIEGTIVVPGNTKIQAGDIVSLTGFSTRFNGNAFITRVVHDVKDGDWITTLTVGAPKRFHGTLPSILDTPASGVIPASDGHQVATVLKNYDDPDKNDRILITLPSFKGKGQEDGLWARLAVPYASTNAGFFFYPEIGDEVLVTFLNNDPRFPIIVGALYNAQNTAPETPDELNQFKSITSRSGIQIRFDDDAQVLTLETPQGNSISVSDDAAAITMTDMNGNSVLLDQDGITLDSSSDIRLSARGEIKLDAGQDIDLKAQADVAIEGTNVDLKAASSFVAEGNASAELSSSGQVQIKGAIVQIN